MRVSCFKLLWKTTDKEEDTLNCKHWWPLSTLVWILHKCACSQIKEHQICTEGFFFVVVVPFPLSAAVETRGGDGQLMGAV